MQRYSLSSTAFKPILYRVVDISKNYNLGDFYSLYIAFLRRREVLGGRSIPLGGIRQTLLLTKALTNTLTALIYITLRLKPAIRA